MVRSHVSLWQVSTPLMSATPSSVQDASDYVFTHAEVQGQFLIPQRLWPMVRRSWYAERKDIVAGRLDLALTQHGLKVCEMHGARVGRRPAAAPHVYFRVPGLSWAGWTQHGLKLCG